MALINSKAVAALVISACVIATVFDGFFLVFSSEEDGDERSQTHSMRRGLLASDEQSDEHTNDQYQKSQIEDVIDLYEQQDHDNDGMVAENSSPVMHPWAQNNLVPNTWTPASMKETILFWHIPKSGGSTAKAIYKCFGKNYKVLSQPSSIFDAQKEGLVASGQVDIIFSSFPEMAAQRLLDPQHKSRALVMLRHPVDRLISKFYYLQIASWEKSYRPDWKGMDLFEWAQTQNSDNNHNVKKLAGKSQISVPTAMDLELAKTTLHERFFVGLMEQFEESIHRFNIVMGVNENEKRNIFCMDRFFAKGAGKSNSNPHPKVDWRSPVWKLLARQNALDIELYEYAVQIFDEQKTMFVKAHDTIEEVRRLKKRERATKRQDDRRRAIGPDAKALAVEKADQTNVIVVVEDPKNARRRKHAEARRLDREQGKAHRDEEKDGSGRRSIQKHE